MNENGGGWYDASNQVDNGYGDLNNPSKSGTNGMAALHGDASKLNLTENPNSTLDTIQKALCFPVLKSFEFKLKVDAMTCLIFLNKIINIKFVKTCSGEYQYREHAGSSQLRGQRLGAALALLSTIKNVFQF